MADPQRAPRRPVDASMTLLNEVMHRPLDPGYAAAAARRSAGIERPIGRVGVLGVLVVALLLGLATTTATRELRRPQPAVAAARELLEEQIRERQSDTDHLVARAAALNGEIAALQRVALQGGGVPNPPTAGRDAVATGAVAVRGPGLVVTLADGEAPADGDESDFAVQDSDVQTVVNALWAGGAEAIAVNNQRLTSLSAIRSAGAAILVDLQPLAGPYRIQAIGDASAMQVAIARVGAGEYLRLLNSRFGIRSSIAALNRVDVPAADPASLRYASPGLAVESSQSTTSTRSTPSGPQPSGPAITRPAG